MFVDLWIVSLFSILFGICAWWNHREGVKKGIQGTLTVLENEKIIMMKGDQVYPYREAKRYKKGVKNV